MQSRVGQPPPLSRVFFTKYKNKLAEGTIIWSVIFPSQNLDDPINLLSWDKLLKISKNHHHLFSILS